MPGMRSYFDKKQGKWYLTAEDAAKWKPGPCVVWEITGQCPLGAKCTCAHLDRAALNDKNQRNRIGNYVECTMPARCKYVLKQIKGGQWAHMKGLVRADVPCLVELLEWLPAQPGGEIDVDVVQSFISANKPVIEIAELSNEEELEAQNLLDDMLILREEEEAKIFSRTPALGPSGDVPTDPNVVAWEFENFQQEEESQQAFLYACQFFADLNDWVYLQEEKRKAEEAAQVAVKAPVARAVKRAFPATMEDLPKYAQLDDSWGVIAMKE